MSVVITKENLFEGGFRHHKFCLFWFLVKPRTERAVLDAKRTTAIVSILAEFALLGHNLLDHRLFWFRLVGNSVFTKCVSNLCNLGNVENTV